MERALKKDQVLGDYGALLRALIPQAIGFYCHSRDGGSLWEEPPPGSVRLDPAYQQQLAALLLDPAPTPTRVSLGQAMALLVPLNNEKDEPLGVLSIVLDSEPGKLEIAPCLDLIRPAVRTLERELSLRLRLLEGYRKLHVQAAEERLLHEVEKALHGSGDCQHGLGQILALCRHFLEVDTAVLLVPGRDIALFQGDRLTRTEVDMLAEGAGQWTAGNGDATPANDRWHGDDLYTVAIRRGDQGPIGILALAGWKATGFSQRRRSRVARYVASHVETLLERSFDRLTGLMAWPAFESLLSAASQTVADSHHALLYFDIDRLHVANDTLGRETGDRILAGFAAILVEELAGHQVTRITADSFAALLMDTDLDGARAGAERIAARFRQLEFGRADRVYRPSVSIGIGALTGDDSRAGGPLAIAKVACDAAKDRGRDRVEVYQSEDHSLIQRFDDIQLVGFVRSAIDRGRLVLLGQPIAPVKAGSGHPYFEVLVRMLDDDDRQVSPGEFLSAAERYQLMEDLDRWVVANTLAALAPRRDALLAARARFAINLSGQSLGSEQFLPFVQEQIVASGVPPEILCFEITESVAVAHLQRAQAFMHALRRIGCSFSLDDFGTGLSSFAYLKLFPVGTLKIDGSFIRDLTSNVVSQSVVAAISEVARVMQLETVAEFVETQEGLNLLGKLGITWAQGYLLGEPAPLAERVAGLVAAPAAKQKAVRSGPGPRGA
jgi:diguanylate cyclase (GGDEF)-like protein